MTMDNFQIIISGFLITFALFNVTAAFYTYRKSDRGAQFFSYLSLCIAIYSFGYAMELTSDTLKAMLFWNEFQYLSLPFLPTIWVLFSFEYYGKPLGWKVTLPILLFSVFIMTFRYTSDSNHLFYLSVHVFFNRYFHVLYIKKGPMYWANALFQTSAMIVSNYLYAVRYKTSSGSIRRQTQMMLVASFFPWISVLLNLLNLSPFQLDYGPFGLTISVVLFLIAYFRYQFLNIKPLARDQVFQSTQDGIIVLDKNFQVIDFNPTAASMFSELNKNAIGENIKLLSNHEGLVESIHQGIESQYDRKEPKSNYKVTPVQLYEKKHKEAGYMITFVDITKYMDLMNELNYLASRDGLTGVFNRRHFVSLGSSVLEESKRHHLPLSIMIFDLDHFKQINDRYGHKAGDEVLKKVADVCRNSLRPEDILARYGGEEFVILLPNTPLAEGQIVAHQLLTQIEAAAIVDEGNKINITASFGIMGVDAVTIETLDDFLIHADRALYLAKSEGRNCVRSTLVKEPIRQSTEPS